MKLGHLLPEGNPGEQELRECGGAVGPRFSVAGAEEGFYIKQHPQSPGQRLVGCLGGDAVLSGCAVGQHRDPQLQEPASSPCE